MVEKVIAKKLKIVQSDSKGPESGRAKDGEDQEFDISSMNVLARDLSFMHSKILSTSLETANVMFADSSSRVFAAHVSEEAHTYLSHLASLVLRLSRQFIAPGLALHRGPPGAEDIFKAAQQGQQVQLYKSGKSGLDPLISPKFCLPKK